MKLCFILACKVNKNYESYIPFYVENIQTFIEQLLKKLIQYVEQIILLRNIIS